MSEECFKLSQFAGTTFVAKRRSGEICGSNGLPLMPSSIKILGRSQLLKSLSHENLCSYLDIIRWKHERMVVVCEHVGKPISLCDEWSALRYARVAKDVLSALSYLHDKGIVHRALNLNNILLINKQIRLFNYGTYYMTGCGSDVQFPIGDPKYFAPEIFLNGPNVESGPKVDIWSLGMIMAELVLGDVFWKNLSLNDIIITILNFIKGKDVFKVLATACNKLKRYHTLKSDLVDLINAMLTVNPAKRPRAAELLDYPIFQPSDAESSKTHAAGRAMSKAIYCTIDKKSLGELYYLWLLAGGDIFSEFKREGLIRTKPPILGLPNLLMLEGTCYGQDKDKASLLDNRVVHLQLGNIITRLGDLPISAQYPLLVVTSKDDSIDQCDSSSLPLIIRERDTNYQLRRINLFTILVQGFPFNQALLLAEAKQDIPPFLRAETWACLLGIDDDYAKIYVKIDKETNTPTDRQIEVDIPRCHQYNELLSSSVGHLKFKRILKAWVVSHPEYVYWQGLDSLCAPFLFLNFNNEACAYACLSRFIEKYLNNFFLKDNSPVIKEYLTKFKQLIVFHDPELGNHLDNIGFAPELFAIPWYLTMFSHVFPINKILHLWDSLFLEKPSYPLFVGFAILQQLRSTLLSSGFNECILLFSDLPEIDIEKCVKDSALLNHSTPKSITYLQHAYKKPKVKTSVFKINPYEAHPNLKISVQPLAELMSEFCPRISGKDFVNLYSDDNFQQKMVIVDIREPHLFKEEYVAGSVNIPMSKVDLTSQKMSLINSSPEFSAIFGNKGKIIVIIGEDMRTSNEFSRLLAHCGLPKVCFLHLGISVLRETSYLTLG